MMDSTTPKPFRAVSLTLASACLLFACGSDDPSAEQDVEDTVEDLGPLVPDLVEFEIDAPDSDEPDVEPPPEPGAFNYPCDSNTECNSGFCIQSAKGRVCTRNCVDECPRGWDCREAPGQDPVFVCLPRFINLCDPCRESEQCNAPGQSGNYCIRDGNDGSFCGAACQEDEGCPEGYVCDDVLVTGGLEVRQCVPADGAACQCSPFAKARQSATDCAIANEHGSCGGTRFCLQQGLSQCDARTPFPESCNGMDDNCNGQTDELPPDYVCGITNEFGTCPGSGTCIDGVETCVGREPAPEMCNGIDDNCDGQTDEGLCDDGNPCTRDFCNSEGTCVNVNDDSLACDDNNVCTQTDLCRDGVCQGFSPLPCGDGNPCFDWTCDPAAGCLSSFNNRACEDGNPCTVNDTCNQGVCVSGGPNPCDDGNECTTGSCEPGVGCRQTERNNGTACSASNLGQCKTGVCQNGTCTAVNVQDGSACILSNLSQCQEAACITGSCVIRPKPSGTVCDYQTSLCESRVPGQCSASGQCAPAQSPNCTVSGCGGVSICCQTYPFGFPITLSCCFDSSGFSCF